MECKKTFETYFKRLFRETEYDDRVLVAKVSGEILGILFVRYEADYAWIIGDLPKAISKKGFSAKTIKETLLIHLEECCRKKGLSEIRVSLPEEKSSLKSLYRENGFTKILTIGMKMIVKDLVIHNDWSLSFHSMNELGFDKFANIVNMSIQGQPFYDNVDTGTILRDYQQREGYDPTLWMTGYIENKPIGFIIPRIWEKGKWTKTNTADILHIGVIPKYRKKGYGTILLKKALESLAEKGIEEVLLWVDSPNFAAKQLYNKVGFKSFETHYSKEIV